jgi:hypothetical protein
MLAGGVVWAAAGTAAALVANMFQVTPQASVMPPEE